MSKEIPAREDIRIDAILVRFVLENNLEKLDLKSWLNNNGTNKLYHIKNQKREMGKMWHLEIF